MIARFSFIVIQIPVLCLVLGCGGGSSSGPSSTSSVSGQVLKELSNTGNGDSSWNTETYDSIVENDFRDVLSYPQSTFSVDVDTAAYGIVRKKLKDGFLPPPGAVRIEELVNYFRYDYAQTTAEHPFSVHVDIADCPWNRGHRLARIAVKGQELGDSKRSPSNLVFLLDVSGSMNNSDKLPLVKSAMNLLVRQLNSSDRVSIVVYAGSSGVVLPPTPGDRTDEILAALDELAPSGGTNGAEGIELAYQLAEQNLIERGTNRVILCTDGDFNLGVTNQSELISLIATKAQSRVFLTVLGFGSGNYKDSMMEKLADQGNGNYAYVDSLQEARRVLVDQIGSTLETIAKDVKLQLDFNPAFVSAYRLIGYENRLLATEDFRDDKKDAGEIGAGHTVTAFYEIVPAGQQSPARPAVPSEFVQSVAIPQSRMACAFVINLRYKSPNDETSQEFQVRVESQKMLTQQEPTRDFRFASSVVAFGMLLRQSPHVGTATWDWVIDNARSSCGPDRDGTRNEFIQLAVTAKKLQQRMRK